MGVVRRERRSVFEITRQCNDAARRGRYVEAQGELAAVQGGNDPGRKGRNRRAEYAHDDAQTVR